MSDLPSALVPAPSLATDPVAAPGEAARHFAALLSYETDCWDVHEALGRGAPGFVVLDVRSPALFAAAHVPGAIQLPHGRITERSLAGFPADTLFVVYCAGPHCNGADRAALRVARLGRRVKKMIGGMSGWREDGFDVATSA